MSKLADILKKLLRKKVAPKVEKEEDVGAITNDLADELSRRIAQKREEERQREAKNRTAAEKDFSNQNQTSDPIIYYAVNGQIRKTTLYTGDIEAFMDWARFVHPIVTSFPRDLRELAMNADARKQLYQLIYNGISPYNTWLRSPEKGLPMPHMGNKNEGH